MSDERRVPVLVTILRRDESDLTMGEIATVRAKFPDREVVFRRTDPRDFKEHAAQCEEFQPTAVLLPRERPIPSLAMEKGFQHIAFTPNGLMELESINPTFRPFVPK